MEILQLEITGIPDAIRSLFISNKKYNAEIERKIREGRKCYEIAKTEEELLQYIACNPTIIPEQYKEILETLRWYKNMVQKVFTITSGNLAQKSEKNNGLIDPKLIQTCHTTVGEFVDISCTVSGLHRGATDDFDAHARTLKNRIIRMSTRTNPPDFLELSDWYKGKVIPFGDLEGCTVYSADLTFPKDEYTQFTFSFPPTIVVSGKQYFRSRYGYVAMEYNGNYDVLRGLTPLGISNLFTFKCDIVGWAHITRLREPGTHAAPELQELIQMINDRLVEMEPCLNSDFLHYCLR